MLLLRCAEHRQGREAAQDMQDMFGRQFECQHSVSLISCMALQTLQYTNILPIYQLNELISALPATAKQVKNLFI